MIDPTSQLEIVVPPKPSYEQVELNLLRTQQQLMTVSQMLLTYQLPEIAKAIAEKEAECRAQEQPHSP